MKYYRICGINITKDDADRLYAVTEGWISALYLLMLSYKDKGTFTTTEDIYRLVESTVYMPLSEEIRGFLLSMSVFTSFSRAQAQYISGNQRVEALLAEIVSKNAFVDCDSNSRTYHIHNILTNFLQEICQQKDDNYRNALYQKAGSWYEGIGEYLTAMHYYYVSGDFERLLSTIELDRGNSFSGMRKDQIISYFEKCPEEVKQRHITALLNYAMALVTFNEMVLFKNTCQEIAVMIEQSGLDSENANNLMGELELLASFTRYNDIEGMSRHHKRACELLKRPSVFMENKGSWTFGTPSVLYMFYRESGKLEQEVYQLREAMPYYYRLTNGHGKGAEALMEAEQLFNMGDFENCEISAYKALLHASDGNQPNMMICSQFLLARIALVRGDYPSVLDLLRKMQHTVERRKLYVLMHKIDMCHVFLYASLQERRKVPQWLEEGDFNSNRLCFPARAFSNIKQKELSLLFPNQLSVCAGKCQYMAN